MTIENLKELALHAVRGTAPAEFSLENVNAAVADGFKEFAGSINQFMKNRYDIYEIINKVADEVVPNKVISAIGAFAEVQQIGQGQKALFHTSLGKARARKFLTRVGLSGVYESFRLDNATFELSGHAVGGAVSIDFERILDGADTLSELVNIITEAMTDSVYGEVQRALRAAYNQIGVPDNNRATGSYDAAEMQKLVTTVKAYGPSAVIFAPPEFIDKMGADAIVPGFRYPATSTTPQSGVQGIYHPDDIDAIHFNGRIKIFRGTPIVEIPQSYTDESNTTTYIDPQMAYIFPAGKEKVVKVVLEGNQQTYDAVNRDQSIEINTYRKLGTAILTYHNWCIYKNTDIPQTYVED